MYKKLMFLVCAVLVLGLSGQAFAVAVKSYWHMDTGLYWYRMYDQVPGASYELHVGTEDPVIANYTFTCDEVVGTLTSATIVAANGDGEPHNSTILPTDQGDNPSYTEVFSPDGSCPYYMKFTWTAAGSGKGHIIVEHPGPAHPVGATLSGAASFNEDWGSGLGGSGSGPVYGPVLLEARIQFASAASGDFESVSPATLQVVIENPEEGITYAVDYAATGGTATAGDDYILAPGTLTFNPGETSKTILIDIIDDGINEDDETIIVELSNPTGGDVVLGDITEHTYTIHDPRVEVSFAAAAGGDSETVTTVEVPVELSAGAPGPVTVDYSATGGTATGGGVDYIMEPGTLSFEPGETSKTISIQVVDDTLEEDDETIELTLSNVTGLAKLGPLTQHIYMIFDKKPSCSDSGDLNNDGIVDEVDLGLFADDWLWTGQVGGYNDSDLDCDGKVDSGDYCVFANQWGEESALLQIVVSYAEALLEHGRDAYGPQHSPLIAAALDRSSLSLTDSAPSIEGIREGDRSLSGANPMHDQDLYQILYALAEVTGREHYAQEADEVLTWFFEHCQSAGTGLMAWGEHISWGFRTETVAGGDTHEFFGPWVLWDRSFQLAQQACVTFAQGLWDHQIHNYTGDFSRHAKWSSHGTGSGQGYPRHGGFYIGTWAKAYEVTQDATFLQAIETVVDHFENSSSSVSGAIPCCTAASRIDIMWPESNLSLALDLWDSADKVPEPLATKMRQRALRTDGIYLSLAHDFSTGGKGFVAGANVHTLQRLTEGPWTDTQIWATAYGKATDAQIAMLSYLRYQQVETAGYRDLVLAAAARYLDSEPDLAITLYPGAIAHAILLMLASHELSGEQQFLDRAGYFADKALEVFMNETSPLPKSSSRHDHYEAITGGDDLMTALFKFWAAKNKPGLALPLVFNAR